MSKTKNKVGTSYRRRKRDFVESVEFPRAAVAASVLLIGFLLLLGALSDASGRPRMLDLGSALYMAAVIGIAMLVINSCRAPTKDCNRSIGSDNRVRRKPSRRTVAVSQQARVRATDSQPQRL